MSPEKIQEQSYNELRALGLKDSVVKKKSPKKKKIIRVKYESQNADTIR